MKKFMRSFILVLAFLIFGGAVIIAQDWNDYIRVDSEVGIVRIQNEITSPFLRVVMFQDGSIRQADDLVTSGTEGLPQRKFAVVSNTGIQLENLTAEEFADTTIYPREWQLPLKGSLLIKQMKVDPVTGLPDFDNPEYYAVSATSDTIISIFWIQRDFSPYPIPVDN